MPCFHPLPAWRSQQLTSKGKLGLTFRRQEGTPSTLDIPCGQCIGCRLEKARQWALRIEHERTLHLNSSFITLTYNDESLPPGGSLRPDDWTRFMKRLRKSTGQNRLRFYQCGEYGETTQRPHHHAIVFGYWPHDGVRLHSYSRDDEFPLWTSASLEKLWGLGNVSVGQVTFETAGYVARYVTKKITGPDAASHYGDRVPEYATMSRRPGIGNGAFINRGAFYYQEDAIILPGGRKVKPPRYYDTLMEKKDPKLLETIKATRRKDGRLSKDNKGTRLTAREACTTAKHSQLKRRDPQ